MASEEPVHPLRIAKNTPASSPSKMASGIPRPLSELSPTSQRRNSPSWNQAGNPKKASLTIDSSPFQSSPLETKASPRNFWQSKNSLDNALYGGGSGSSSPVRRTSIERLQKASRVKNSNILALEQKQEYDPTRVPHVERPLAKVQGNAFGGTGVSGQRSEAPRRGFGHHRNESQTHIPLYSPTKSSSIPALSSSSNSVPPPRTPVKDHGFPTKSALSPTKFKSSFDTETSPWTSVIDDEHDGPPGGRSLHRHAKSVTFDAAPPQVNEYEMATPDLSSIGTNSREGSYESEEDDNFDGPYHHGDVDGQDDSFDASLEDTDKTPVVGPDDWRQDHGDDAYEASPMPESAPSQAAGGRPQHTRTDSTNSNGEHRPLPPLPGALERTGSRSSPGLAATAERMLGVQRGLPSPPPAGISKSEIQNIGNGNMPLEERLKLMMLSDDTSSKSKAAAAEQRERRLRRAGARDRLTSPTPDSKVASQASEEAGEEDDTIGDLSALGDFQLPPRISRESILRRVNGNKTLDRESDYHFSSPPPSSSPERRLPLDPDIPIPSTEDSIFEDDTAEDDEGSVIVRRDADHEKDDVYDLYGGDDDDITSRYSDEESREEPQSKETEAGVMTPRAVSPLEDEKATAQEDNSNGLPMLADGRKDVDFRKTFQQFMLSEPEEKAQGNEVEAPEEPQAPKMAEAHAYLQRPYTPEQPLSKPEYDGTGWGDDEEFEPEPGTPDSVIHHPMPEDEEARDSPAIPEQLATIKSASGSKLKTRPSATPADLLAMRQARRQVSGEVPVPAIPERHRNRISRDMEAEQAATGDDFLERHPSFKQRSLTLDLDLGLSLDEDIERVIEAQKRGYLMRQNTKLVSATDKEADDLWKTRSAGNSPVKAERPQSWTVEPWNGKVRPRSVKKRPGVSGPVPPLPGQESNATALAALPEDDLQAEMATEESGERGRLFVKVMGVKDLDMPIPKNERTWFSLTLDNGVHCVTTAWLEMARNAPIGQEFELVVPNDLEFQLTLNVKLEKPAPRQVMQSPSKTSRVKPSTLSRVFASPKKRKEMEMRQREEDERQAQQQRDAQARQMNAAPTAWDLLSPLAAEDGSFARSYVCLKEHEQRCFGRPYLVDVACFNEWATEEAGFASSVKSKRGGTAVVRRAPYKVGKLELQLLFVPRPKSATDDDMPKSMNSCIRELKAAEERLSRNWEGHLSQQGGDCPYWRRRFFKLVGPKLTAYHEATRQPRATINLSNAKRLIDDRRALVEKETTGKGGRRRRSAFAEEEEGYMFVEEGFRIRFNNGEVIDFYADTAEEKEGWMKVLSDVVDRGEGGSDDSAPRKSSKWCELVLKREEALRRRAEGRRVHSRTKSMYA